MICERAALVRDAAFQTREEGGTLTIEGYFAVFGSQYRMWENAVETISPEAFDGALGEDVRALVNHDTTLVLGRTSAGTLSLRVDERGLWGSITVNPADQDAVNLYQRVRRGDVSQCSFGFDILAQDIEEREDGTVQFVLRKVKLYEVSVVTFPAYEDTLVQARRKDYDAMKQRKHDQWQAEMLAKVRK